MLIGNKHCAIFTTPIKRTLKKGLEGVVSLYFECYATMPMFADARSYFELGLPTILDKIKWNSKPPSPPNQGWSRAKGKNAPFSHPWFGGEKGSRFSIYFVQDCSCDQFTIKYNPWFLFISEYTEVTYFDRPHVMFINKNGNTCSMIMLLTAIKKGHEYMDAVIEVGGMLRELRLYVAWDTQRKC